LKIDACKQGKRAEDEASPGEGRRGTPGVRHERKPSLEPGVLRMYRWEGPGGRDASPGKKREAAIASVVAVVCCPAEDAAAMLDFCGWDVTHAVERFLAGHPVPGPCPQRHPAQIPPTQQAAGRGAGRPGAAGRGSGAAGRGGGVSGGAVGQGAGGGGAAAACANTPGRPASSDVGMVRLPAGTGTGNGRVQFADGSSFTGNWVDGVVQGHGHFCCGDKEYTGDFLNGRMHGQGVHRWTKPALIEYDGAWSDGLMHGSGIVTKGADRRRYQCTFDSGRLTHQKALSDKVHLNAEEKSYMVSIFRSVLQESTEAEAEICLSQHDWNLQNAIKAALQGNPTRSLFDGNFITLTLEVFPSVRVALNTRVCVHARVRSVSLSRCR
jgi:hypothetical protein